MCNVCIADRLIKGETLSVTSKSNKIIYQIRGDSECAEFKPCEYMVRKIVKDKYFATELEPLNLPSEFLLRQNGVNWTKTFKSNDLAGVVSSGGFDLNDKSRSIGQDEWIEKHFVELMNKP